MMRAIGESSCSMFLLCSTFSNNGSGLIIFLEHACLWITWTDQPGDTPSTSSMAYARCSSRFHGS